MMHVLLCWYGGGQTNPAGREAYISCTYFCCFLKFLFFFYFGFFSFCFSLSHSSAFFSSLIYDYAPMIKPTQPSCCTHYFSTRTSVEGFRSRNCPCGRTGIEPDPRSINRWSHLCLAKRRRSQKEEEWGRWANARLLACAKIFQSHYSALFFVNCTFFVSSVETWE